MAKVRLVSSRKDAKAFYFICENCSEESVCHPNTSKGRFCSNTCQGEYRRRESNAKVEAGLGSANTLKRYLIERDGEKCSICDITEWMNKPVTFQLDHVDGNSDNNRLENGRILCPTCHSQTETFTGRNIKNAKRNRYLKTYKAEKKQIRS